MYSEIGRPLAMTRRDDTAGTSPPQWHTQQHPTLAQNSTQNPNPAPPPPILNQKQNKNTNKNKNKLKNNKAQKKYNNKKTLPQIYQQ